MGAAPELDFVLVRFRVCAKLVTGKSKTAIIKTVAIRCTLNSPIELTIDYTNYSGLAIESSAADPISDNPDQQGVNHKQFCTRNGKIITRKRLVGCGPVSAVRITRKFQTGFVL